MLQLEHISHAYNAQQVLKDIGLEIHQGEIICLLGPSGCGKTTLLRIIAGLEPHDSGNLLFNNQSLDGIPSYQRDFGLMFQEYALFPHMNVAQNVAFGLKMKKLSKTDTQQLTQSALELVGLTGFDDRDVNSLSGGERQRVALARSLAPNPQLLMLDEPLGSLDAALREQLVIELRDIIKQTGITSIYVTHDQHEAFAISDRIIIMHDGSIEQIGTAQELYDQPQTQFVARFLGLQNIIPLTSAVAADIYDGSLSPDITQALLLHPDFITLATPTSNEYIGITGIVVKKTFLGKDYRLTMTPNVAENLNLTFYVTSQEQHIPALKEQITIYYPHNKILSLQQPPEQVAQSSS